MKELKWEGFGSVSIGRNPPVPIHRCILGMDKDGRTWVCEVSPQIKISKITGLWYVKFDNTNESSGDFVFLRKEVTEARGCNYWDMRKKVYHEKVVKYEEIQDVIEDFMNEFGVQ